MWFLSKDPFRPAPELAGAMVVAGSGSEPHHHQQFLGLLAAFGILASCNQAVPCRPNISAQALRPPNVHHPLWALALASARSTAMAPMAASSRPAARPAPVRLCPRPSI